MPIPMPQPTEPELPPLAADAPPNCDTPECFSLATHSYAWDWGATGVKCSLHAGLLNQTAGNLQRTVQISLLQRQGPVPLLRDERIQLTATAMVLKEELAEAKLRGLDLYRENMQLTAQVQSVTVRGRELDAQLKDRALELERAKADLAASEALQGELSDEVGRLRVLAKFLPDASVIDAEPDPEVETTTERTYPPKQSSVWPPST